MAMPYHFRMKIIGIAGFSGSGKTTLIEKLIPIHVELVVRMLDERHAHAFAHQDRDQLLDERRLAAAAEAGNSDDFHGEIVRHPQ